MAIKGRSKSRGARTVARGPKPAYVPVKVPWYRRRGLWLVVATLLAVAAVEGLVYGFLNERDDNRAADEQQRMATAVNRYRDQVERVLVEIGNKTPPSGFTPFADLGTAISGLEADTVTKKSLDLAASAGDSTAKAAGDAANTFDDIGASRMVGGHDFTQDFVLYVLNSKDGFALGARLYREAALLTSMAAAADEGQARDDLVARARSVQSLAEQAFSGAYSDYVQAQIMAGVYTPQNLVPQPAAGLTGVTGATGGTR